MIYDFACNCARDVYKGVNIRLPLKMEKKMLPTRRCPAHPGKILRLHFLEPLGITQSRFVEHLGGTWTLGKLNNIIHGKRNVTPAIALDFADALNTSPEFWMNLQLMHDLWKTFQEHRRIAPMEETIAI